MLAGCFEYGDYAMVSNLIQQQGGEIYLPTQILQIDFVIVGKKTHNIDKVIETAIQYRQVIVNEDWLFSSLNHQTISDPVEYHWKRPVFNNFGNKSM